MKYKELCCIQPVQFQDPHGYDEIIRKGKNE